MAADELNPPLGTTTPEIFLDNVKRADRLVNGPAGTVNDRAGEPLDTWRQMMAKNDEIRQNIIPLSKQYMTLEAAQADIANIPEGSTTYVRSQDGSALADEYINNAGVLTATGRRLISKEYVDALVDAIYERIKPLQASPDALFDIVSRNGLRPFKIDDDNGEISLSLIARLLTGDSGLNFSGNILDNNAPEG
ncbi:hypothetical protein VXE42_21415, partial [Klebsiella oxytoca]|nr:hypothetical protein [Klebsiella oxytoca]